MLRTALHQALLATLCTLSFVSCLPAAAQEAPNDALPAAPEGAVEVVARRGTHSQTFQKGNQFILRTYTGPVFYDADGQGSLRPVRTDLKPSARGGGAAYEATENRARVFLPGSAKGPVTVESRGYEVSFQPVGAQEAPGRLTGSSGGMAFPQAFALGDLEYQVLRRGGVKETVVLRDASSPRTYRWRLRSTKLQARLEGKRVLLADTAAGLSDPELVMPAPYAEDARGKRTEEIEVTLTGLQDGVYDLTYTLPDAFCQSAVYPVRLDPTVTLPLDPQDGVGKDNHTYWYQEPGLCISYQTSGLGDESSMGVAYPPGCDYRPFNQKAYLAFPSSDVSGQVPLGSTITGARISIYKREGCLDTLGVYPVTRHWAEDDLPSDTPYGPMMASISRPPYGRSYLQSPALTQRVQDIYEGRTTNYGWCLASAGYAPDCTGMTIGASEGGSSEAPYQEVTYTPGSFTADPTQAGPPPRWAGADAAGPVTTNLLSGNVHLAIPLYSYPTVAGPVGVTLYYNSQENTTGALGPKWSHSFASRLSISGTSPSRTVTEILGDGTRVTYTESGAGIFVGPTYSFESLSVEGSGFVVGCCGQTKRHYDAAGLLRSVEDRHGNRLTLNYNAQNQVTSVSAAGRGDTAWNQFEYSNGRLARVYDRLGNSWVLGYSTVSGVSTLTTVSLPADAPRPRYTFQYNAWHGLSGVGTPDWNTDTQRPYYAYSLDYDGYQRLVSCSGPNRYYRAYRYLTAATEVTDFLGRVAHYGYYTPMAGVTLLQTVTDPMGALTTFRWDESRHLVTGTRTPTNQQYGAGFWTTEATYNEKGKVLSSTQNLRQSDGTVVPRTTLYEYDHTTHTQPTRVTTPGGTETLYYYDGETPSTPWGATVGWRDLTRIYLPKPAGTPEIGYTELTYQPNGLLTTRRDARGGLTTYEYNGAGDLTGTTDPLSRKTEVVYDSQGRPTARKVTVSGVTVVPEIDYTYRYDRLREETRPDGSVLYDWMPEGPPRRVERPDGTVEASYTYTASGLVSTENQVSYGYDVAGRLLSIAGPHGYGARYTYDAADRILEVWDTEASPEKKLVSYTYDADGRQLTATFGSEARSTRSYDNLGRLLEVRDTYGLHYSGKVVAASRVTYDADGRVTDVVREWDVDSSVHKVTQAHYTYDALSQLLEETRDGDQALHLRYTYDLAANRTRVEDLLTGARQDYSYDAANQVSTRQKYLNGVPQGSPQSYTHDYSGNMTQDAEGRTFQYNYRNRLTRATYLKSGWTETVTHTWNGLDQRVETEDTGGYILPFQTYETHYQYIRAGNRVIMEAEVPDDPSDVHARYYYGNGPVARKAREEDCSTGVWVHRYQYLHQDYLGSLVAMSDEDGCYYSSYGYTPWRASTDAWGDHLQVAVDSSTQSTNRSYGAAHGYERTNSGLLDVGVRAYDPALGRFLQRDEVDEGNPYAYAANDPVGHVDPDGRAKERPWWLRAAERGPKFLYCMVLLKIVQGLVNEARAYVKKHMDPTEYDDPTGRNNQLAWINGLVKRWGFERYRYKDIQGTMRGTCAKTVIEAYPGGKKPGIRGTARFDQ